MLPVGTPKPGEDLAALAASSLIQMRQEPVRTPPASEEPGAAAGADGTGAAPTAEGAAADNAAAPAAGQVTGVIGEAMAPAGVPGQEGVQVDATLQGMVGGLQQAPPAAAGAGDALPGGQEVMGMPAMDGAAAAAEEMARAGAAAAAAAGLGPNLGMLQGEGLQPAEQGKEGMGGAGLVGGVQVNSLRPGDRGLADGAAGDRIFAGFAVGVNGCGGASDRVQQQPNQGEVGDRNPEAADGAMQTQEPGVRQSGNVGEGVGVGTPASAHTAIRAAGVVTTPDKVWFPPHLADMQAVLLAHPDTFTHSLVDYSSLVKTVSPVVQSPSKVRSIPRASLHTAGSSGGAQE